MAQPNNFGPNNGQFGRNDGYMANNNNYNLYQGQQFPNGIAPEFSHQNNHQQQQWQLWQLQQQLQQRQGIPNENHAAFQQQQQQQQQQQFYASNNNGSGHWQQAPPNDRSGVLYRPMNSQNASVPDFRYQQPLFNPSMRNEFEGYNSLRGPANPSNGNGLPSTAPTGFPPHLQLQSQTQPQPQFQPQQQNQQQHQHQQQHQNENERTHVVKPSPHHTNGYIAASAYNRYSPDSEQQQQQAPQSSQSHPLAVQPAAQSEIPSPVHAAVPPTHQDPNVPIVHNRVPKIKDDATDDQGTEDDVVILDERLIPMSDRAKVHIYSKLGDEYDEEKEETFTISKANIESPVSSNGDIIPVPNTKKHNSPSVINNKKRFTNKNSPPTLNNLKKENIKPEAKQQVPTPTKSSSTTTTPTIATTTTTTRPFINTPAAPVIAAVKQTSSQTSEDGKKRPSPAEIIASIRKKPRSSPDPNSFNPSNLRFEQDLAALTKSFEMKESVLPKFLKLIKDNVEYFTNDPDQLLNRICDILLSIPESLYHQKPDYRYEGLAHAIHLINDRAFWLSSNLTTKKTFLRVRTWLYNDLKAKDLDGIEKSLSLLHEIKHSKENLEKFKLWDILGKIFKKMDKFPKIKALANELMTKDINVPPPKEKAVSTQSASTSSVMKSISAAAKNVDTKPVTGITRSSIFINDPNKNKREAEKAKENSAAQLQQQQQQKKVAKKTWALSDYLSKASQKSQQQQQIQQQEKVEADEDERVRTETGLISILRRKSPQQESRKRRKAAAKGVRFKDVQLESVRIIESYDRGENVSNINAVQEGSAMMGVVDDEEMEWSDPIPFNVASLPWYNAELYDGNPSYRGGDVEISSADRAEQIKRNAVIPGTNYLLTRNIPQSPHEPSSLNVLPPKTEEAKMIPFGSAGR